MDRPSSRRRRSGTVLILILPVVLLAGIHHPSCAQSAGCDRPERCGTPWALEIHAALEHPELLTPTVRDAYESARSRPVLQASLDTEHFRIHYDTSGQDAILWWPDTGYLDAVAIALERSWSIEVDTLGFRPPPSDANDPGDNGGNGLYDCYVLNLGTSFYGITHVGYAPPGDPPDDVTSYLFIDNDYHDFGYADPTLPMRVTVAHEFNHACQFAHILDAEDVWYMECSAVWAEDSVYDDLNDYYQFLPYYLGYPYRSLEYRGTAMYGSAVWNFFLAERFGRGVVPTIWSEMESGIGSVNALTSRLGALGTSLEDEFFEFTVWNWFIGSRDDGAHYEEGAAWPDVAETWTTSNYPIVDAMVSTGVRPDHLGANYIVFDNPVDICESIEIAYDGPLPYQVPNRAALMTLDGSGAVASQTELVLDGMGDAAVEVAEWNTLSSIVLVAANVAPWSAADDMQYTVSAAQTAPYNGAFAAALVEPLAVSVSWTLDTIEALTSIRVERATSEDGAFEPVGAGDHAPALSGSVLDDNVVAGDDLRYRLVLVRVTGGETTIPGGVARVTVPGSLPLSISHAMPNPFIGSTSFELALPETAGEVTVRIHDVAGRFVREIASERLAYGRHRVNWNGKDEFGEGVSSGVYLCSFEYEGTRLTRKLTLLR